MKEELQKMYDLEVNVKMVEAMEVLQVKKDLGKSYQEGLISKEDLLEKLNK